MAQRLKDKVALVTGGSMGIGRAIAEAFAEEGARLIVADIDDAGGRAVVRAVQAQGGAASFVHVDVADIDSVESMRRHIAERYGRLDVLVCSAAIYTRGEDVVQLDAAVFDRVMAVNLKGVFNCCKVAIPFMREAGGGSIINLTSSVGWHSTAPGVLAYSTSKFAVTGMTKAMAMDHLHENIRVNGIAPGPTDTPLLRASRPPDQLEAFKKAQPIGRLGEPAEIAAAAVFLASDEASFITGVILPVDGGQTTHI
ncbi:MAG: SDR family oxidoreductase [Anaerolineae bacterium]|nr:SDR family oxidoreductase [Anaerolineae bacterium]